MTFHTHRHTCAPLLFDQGRNAKRVQRWLGHHSAAFALETYIHLLSDELDAARAPRGGRQRRQSAPRAAQYPSFTALRSQTNQIGTPTTTVRPTTAASQCATRSAKRNRNDVDADRSDAEGHRDDADEVEGL
jgi:hypothetical protein